MRETLLEKSINRDNSRPSIRYKKGFSITLEISMMEVLDKISAQEGVNRSALINGIIKTTLEESGLLGGSEEGVAVAEALQVDIEDLIGK